MTATRICTALKESKRIFKKKVPASAYNFFCVFYTHKHSIKLCSNTLNIYLYVSKVIFTPLAGLEMRVTQIFLFFP